MTNYGSKRNTIGKRLRKKRLATFLEMIRGVSVEKGRVDILDIGGTEDYWSLLDEDFLTEHNVTITLLNLTAPCVQDKCRFNAIVGDAATDI